MKPVVLVLLRTLAVAAPVAAGIFSIIFSGSLAQAPLNKERNRPTVPVRILTLAPTMVVPRVSGYGTVAPAREWDAVARVEGEVIETSPLLANGHLAPAGTMLLRIDDTDLKLALAQADAQESALDVKDQTLKASLEISRADLALNETELDRQRELEAKGVATQAAVDQAERTALAARARVTEIENQLALNAAERKVLAAQRAIAERNLEFTTITAPYDMRIGTVSAELGQVVTRGATLVTGEGIEAAEVTAQYPIGLMGPVVRALGPDKTVLDLKAVVRLAAPDHTVEWPAIVERVAETIDARTQSAQIVVRVDAPLDHAQPGVRPPLRRNMFVEVELSAPPREALVVPTSALQSGKALVVAEGDKLAERDVATAYVIGDIAVVKQGLKPSDRLVVTDLSIAVPGMTVKPVEDEPLQGALARAAMGKAPAE
jgi:RND family efflux transporter MFP subunit